MRFVARALAVALALTLTVLVPGARASTVDLDSFLSSEDTVVSGAAATGRALALAVGDTSLTIGQNTGSFSFSELAKVTSIPRIDPALLVNCDAGTLVVGGTSKCLDRARVAAGGLSLPETQRVVSIQDLVAAGIAQLSTTTDSSSNSSALGTSHGLLVPGLAEGAAECSLDNPNSSETGLELPAQLQAVLTASLGFAHCTASPTSLKQSSGVSEIGLTLTQTILNAGVEDVVDGVLEPVQGLLDPLPDAVKDPVNNTIDNIKQELSSAPVLTLSLAPNTSELDNLEAALSSVSESGAIVLTLLNGLATVEVASANATAGVTHNGTGIVPTADADPALVRVKVLNLSLDNPFDGEPLIDLAIDPTDLQRSLAAVPVVEGVVEASEDGIVLFRGTPLETHISLAKATTCTDDTNYEREAPALRNAPLTADEQAAGKQICTVDGDPTRYNALAMASAVGITAFGTPTASGANAAGPLPVVDLRLSEANATAFRGVETGGVQPQVPLTVLPRTGAPLGATVLAGLGIIGLATLVRRRFFAN